jgi:hypothetical protein
MYMHASLSCSQGTAGVGSVALDERSTNSIEQGAIKLCVPSTVAHMPQTTIQLLQVSYHLCIRTYACMRACAVLHVP